jgi:carboxymethylenebutenolidase
MANPPIPVPFFLARPAGTDVPSSAGIVVLMEGMGISPQLLRVCERLAGEGYLVVAPDLFHRSGGSDPAKLPDQLRSLQLDDALHDIASCADELHRLGATSVGVTGFCMGGRLTYATATSDVEVDAAAPFYGAGIGALLGTAGCPILCFFGGDDEYVPADEIAAVEAHHPDDVVVYPDAGHGFMRDGSDSYDADAAADAWARLLAFFGEHLAPSTSP